MPMPDRDRAKQLLERRWGEVVAGEVAEESVVAVGDDTRDCIRELMSSEAVAFTYSLPTQLLGKLLFVLLLATIAAQHWFASTPLPFGGPNVILAGSAALLALCLVALRSIWPKQRAAALSEAVATFRPLGPVMAVSLLLLGWALAVHLATDSPAPPHLAQMALGIGILCAVFLCVHSAQRAAVAAMAFVVASFVSTVFGLAVAFLGEPFLTLWLQIADVQPYFLQSIYWDRRLAGTTGDPQHFSSQLAVAVPLAFAALLRNPLSGGPAFRKICSLALYLMLMTMITALIIHGSLSSICAAGLAGCIIVALLSWRTPQARRQLLVVLASMALWLLAVFNPALQAAIDTPYAGPGIEWRRMSMPTLATSPDGIDLAIKGLRVADESFKLADGRIPLAPIRKLEPGREYLVQLRAQGSHWYGPAAEIVAKAKKHGGIMLTWQALNAPDIIGYQRRLQAVGDQAWTAWHFTPGVRGTILTTERLAVLMRRSPGNWKWMPHDRLWSNVQLNIASRGYMASTAWRYALEHPWGAGAYAPSQSHLSAALLQENPEDFMILGMHPHNQFLFVLVNYGFPGLILLMLFYACLLRSIVHSAGTAARSGDAALHCLAAAVGGALCAYGVQSLTHGMGPFTGDWGHFLLIGLAFGIQRTVVFRNAHVRHRS